MSKMSFKIYTYKKEKESGFLVVFKSEDSVDVYMYNTSKKYVINDLQTL